MKPWAHHLARASLAGWLLLPVILTGGGMVMAAEQPGPRELVIEVSDRLVDALREHREEIRRDGTVAEALAEDIVVPHVDMDYVARLVLGKHWRNASPAQRAAFTRAFKRYLMNTYITAMQTYTEDILSQADKVRYLPLSGDAGERQDVLVRSEILLPQGKTALVGYRMRHQDGVWKIYDLTIDGVSLALTYRNEFSAKLRQQSLDALIEELETRNRQGT